MLRRLCLLMLCCGALAAPAWAVTYFAEEQVGSVSTVYGNFYVCFYELPPCVVDGDCPFVFTFVAQQFSAANSPSVTINLGKRAGQIGTPYGLKAWVNTKDGTGKRVVGPTLLRFPPPVGGDPSCVSVNAWHTGTNEQMHVFIQPAWPVIGAAVDQIIQVPGMTNATMWRKRLQVTATVPDEDSLRPFEMSLNLPGWSPFRQKVSTPPLLACPVSSPGYRLVGFYLDDCDPSN